MLLSSLCFANLPAGRYRHFVEHRQEQCAMQSSFALTGMRTLGKRVVLILAALALILGAASFSQNASAAPVAQAAPTAKAAAACWGGSFVNGSSGIGIGGITNWTSGSSVVYNNQGWNFIVQPGQSSKQYRCDTDGYFIGYGYCAQERYVDNRTGLLYVARTVRAGTQGVSVKISDLPQANVRAYRC